MTRPKVWYLIYDHCGWHSCSKHNLWRDFVDGLIDNGEKVASSKKHIQFKTRMQKPYLIYEQKIMAKIDPLFMTKMVEKPYPLGLHIPAWIVDTLHDTSGRSGPWAKAGARFCFACPASFSFFCDFFFFLPKIRGSLGPPGPSSRSATAYLYSPYKGLTTLPGYSSNLHIEANIRLYTWGDTAVYGLYRYVLLWRVQFSSSLL